MKRKIKRQFYNTNKIKRDPFERKNNLLIKDEKERQHYELYDCPACNSGQIYYRVKTKDYKCKVCNHVFYFDGNKYKIIKNITIDELRVLEGLLLLAVMKDNNDTKRKLFNKIKNMIESKRGNILWK